MEELVIAEVDEFAEEVLLFGWVNWGPWGLRLLGWEVWEMVWDGIWGGVGLVVLVLVALLS